MSTSAHPRRALIKWLVPESSRTRAPCRRFSSRPRGSPMTSSTLGAVGVGGFASGTRLDSGTAGGWPLRTGPGSARSRCGFRGLSGRERGDGGVFRGGCGRSCDHAAQAPGAPASGGASDPVQPQSAARSSCVNAPHRCR